MIRPRATASPLNFCINTFVSSGHFANRLLSRAHLPCGTRWNWRHSRVRHNFVARTVGKLDFLLTRPHHARIMMDASMHQVEN